MSALLPPSLPADARYRPLRLTVTDYDRHLADVTPVAIPRGIITALTAHLYHSCTPLQRPLNRTGICRACDLIGLAKSYSTVLEAP